MRNVLNAVVECSPQQWEGSKWWRHLSICLSVANIDA